MLNIGPQELLLILVVALLVVGPRRLPEIGRSLGKGLREIRKAQDEVRKTIKVELDDLDGPNAPTASPRSTPRDTPAAEPDGDGAHAPSAAAATGAAVGEVSKTLGRSLAELRKARQELQRSFRVDLDGPAAPSPGPAAPSVGSVAPSAEALDPEAAGGPEAASGPDAAPAPE